MKRLLICVLVTAVLGFQGKLHTALADDNATGAAVKAAQVWLALVGSGKYAESWEEAAQMSKAQVSKEQWVKALTSARSPLGRVESRTLKSSTYTK